MRKHRSTSRFRSRSDRPGSLRGAADPPPPNRRLFQRPDHGGGQPSAILEPGQGTRTGPRVSTARALPCRWTTVQLPTWRCPIMPTPAIGQLSDSERGAVQRGWNLHWNPGASCNRPVGGGFPRFQVQPDNIGHLSTNCLFLYTGMTPRRPVQIRCPKRDDSQVPAFGGPGQPVGAIIDWSDRLKVGAPRSLPLRSWRWWKETLAAWRRRPRA